jgi:hypothetical protein
MVKETVRNRPTSRHTRANSSTTPLHRLPELDTRVKAHSVVTARPAYNTLRSEASGVTVENGCLGRLHDTLRKVTCPLARLSLRKRPTNTLGIVLVRTAHTWHSGQTFRRRSSPNSFSHKTQRFWFFCRWSGVILYRIWPRGHGVRLHTGTTKLQYTL